jgi:hypothetical protein
MEAMLGGSLVTTAWHVLGLWMEGQPPAVEGGCKYMIKQIGQSTKGDPPARGLGMGPTTLPHKKISLV